ncbi:MAG: TraR/DksA C4-type zinc finger protein [Candidatus Shapirobacteria bacterium]|nr:TraR/DksA C4-type zinc finger protein [Candidatus Shapirobacteria bacterium]
MKESKQKIKSVKLSSRFLESVKRFLVDELLKMKRTKKDLEKSDPFTDENRTLENSEEEDLDEQIGHFDSEVKVRFLSKRIVQIRKALTRVKLGKYGICESCGKMIDTERLSINPEATNCVECQKEKES